MTTVYLMADAAVAAKAGQKTPDGFYNIERMLKRVLASARPHRLTCVVAGWRLAHLGYGLLSRSQQKEYS